MRAIDVCIPTSGNTPHLNEAMAQIRKCIPVNNIFRADGGTLGNARQRLIDSVTTERFLMLDSDVVLETGPWFDHAIESDAAVALQVPLATDPLKNFVAFWRGLHGGNRFFGTMAIFLSKEKVRNMKIPDMDACEDIYMMIWLQNHAIPIEIVWVKGTHYHSNSVEKGRWVGSGLRRLQREVGFRKVFSFWLRNVILFPLTVSIASMLTNDRRLERYGVSLWRRYIAGYFGRQ